MAEKRRTVIVGGGVIGAATAFFISRHPKFDPKTHEVIMFEATAPACAASGKAGGLLSRTAFPQVLGPLSYRLHTELAEEFDGEKRWGYRRVNTMSVEGSATHEDEEHTESVINAGRRGPTSPKLKGQNIGRNKRTSKVTKTNTGRKPSVELPEDLNWIKPEMLEYAELLGGSSQFSQVHPYWFTDFLVTETQRRGCLDLRIARVTDVLTNPEGKCVGVDYVTKEEGAETQRLMADTVIVTAGPWTSTLVEGCPVVGMKVPSITVAPTQRVSAFALFTELDIPSSGHVAPEIYARKDEIYICGETIDDPLPTYASEIAVDDSYGDLLFRYGSLLSDQIAGGKIKRRQACYLPVVDSPNSSGPFIGKTNVPNLLLAAGHTCWGINNAPATGLLMAELLLDGRATSSNIRSLSPSKQFDSSNNLTVVK